MARFMFHAMFHIMFHDVPCHVPYRGPLYIFVPFVPFVWYNRFMEQYVKINVKESVRIKLKQLAAENGQTLADYIESLIRVAPDDLLDELDKKSSDPYASLRQNLDDDELPECCQGIFTGLAKDRCEHWEWVNGGWKNKVTGKYANDPMYYHYV